MARRWCLHVDHIEQEDQAWPAAPHGCPRQPSPARRTRSSRWRRRRRGADATNSVRAPGVLMISASGVRALLTMLPPPVGAIYEDTARAPLVTVPGVSPELGNSALDVSLALIGRVNAGELMRGHLRLRLRRPRQPRRRSVASVHSEAERAVAKGRVPIGGHRRLALRGGRAGRKDRRTETMRR